MLRSASFLVPSRRTSLDRRWLLVMICAWLVLVVPAMARHEDDEEEGAPYAADAAEVRSFARVRSADGRPTVIREDGTSEALERNLPIYPGDRLNTESDGRTEIQLPDGNLLYVDRGSDLELYDLFDPSEPDRSETLVGVARGSVRLEIDTLDRDDAVRIDTPAASIYVLTESSFRIDIGSGDTVEVSVRRGRVELAAERDSVVIRAGQRSTVRPGGRPGAAYRFNLYGRDEFDRWCERLDDAREPVARGEEYEYLPDEVRPYYGELSRNGRWVYDDEYGWVWNPSTIDDDWRPYVSGYWDYGPFGPTWVSYDPWGWCTSRYGRWEWRFGRWCWIPGRVYSTAHVYWYYGPDYVGWCPLGWWDRPLRLSFSIGWGHPFFDDCSWRFIGYDHFYRHDVRRYQPPRNAVVADVRRGVVSRDAVVVRAKVERDGNGRVVRRQAVNGETLKRETFRRAQSAAAQPDGRARVVAKQHNQRELEDRRTAMSFRERESTQLERRRVARAPREVDSRERSTPSGEQERVQAPSPHRDNPRVITAPRRQPTPPPRVGRPPAPRRQSLQDEGQGEAIAPRAPAQPRDNVSEMMRRIGRDRRETARAPDNDGPQQPSSPRAVAPRRGEAAKDTPKAEGSKSVAPKSSGSKGSAAPRSSSGGSKSDRSDRSDRKSGGGGRRDRN